MPVIIAILGALAAAGIWYWRMRAAGQAAQDLAGVAQDVISAARRFGFRRRYNEHPVDSLQEPEVAIAGAAIAFMELSGLPSTEQQDALLLSLQHHLGQDRARAEEAMILGRWLVNECGGAAPGLSRLSKRLRKLQGAEALPRLMPVLQDVAKSARGGDLSTQQREALAEITRVFRLT